MTHQTRVYWHGVVSAGVNSLAGTITVIVVDPATFNISSVGGLKHVFLVFAVSAVLGMALYVKAHPIPEPTDSDFVQVTKDRIAEATTQLYQGTGGGGMKVEVEIPKDKPFDNAETIQSKVTIDPPPAA